MARRMSSAVAVLTMLGCVIGAGCSASGGRDAAAKLHARDLPTYADIAERYNARAERLDRVWARAVVSVWFTDDKGKQRWEQGEGHFQLIQPSRLALSVGKLGEVFLWIGCDDTRYWVIDAKEADRAYVGRHEFVTREKISSLGLPAAPASLIRLTGATPLPVASPELIYGWSGDGKSVIVEHREDGAIWRYTIDPDNGRPSRIDLLRAEDRVIEATASLEDYAPVTLTGVPAFFPEIASRISAEQPGSEARMRVSLAGLSDGGRSRLEPESFDFEYLISALGVQDTVDLDEPVAAR